MNGAQPRRRGRRLHIVFAVVAVLAVLLVASGGLVLYARTQLEPPDPSNHQAVAVEVRHGEGLDQLAADLAAQHLVKSEFFFRWFARFKGLTLHEGRYRLDPAMGASAVVARLDGAPDIATVKLFLAEGLTAEQMAAKVEAAGIGITAAQYMAEVRTGTFGEAFLQGRPAGASLEGFLFPDTYEVPRTGVTAHALVTMQLDDFAARAVPLLASPPHGLTPYQLLTIASVVEKEGATHDDRTKVASVFYNRLAAGMPLGSDAVIAYGVGKNLGDLTADDLQKDTPYNSRLHTGPPPTPIANPGTDSIGAAAHPATTAYLYFVAGTCGRDFFGTTSADFDELVRDHLNKPC